MAFSSASERLIRGNSRFRNRFGPKRISSHLKGQKPFAVIIGCSDSRVPPEVLFDQVDDVGKLFVIRVAGNIVEEPSAMGSVEYAVEHLNVPLIIVLGHTSCGAVTEVVKGLSSGSSARHDIDRLMKCIRPYKELSGRAQLYGIELKDKETLKALASEDIEKAIQLMAEANVDRQVNLLLENHFVRLKKPEVLGLMYSLENGRMRLVNEQGKRFRF